MGRLVSDEASTGRFAGSTTGVHFVLSVEQLCRRISPHLEPFPETCYRSQLLQPADYCLRENAVDRFAYGAGAGLLLTFDDSRQALNMSLEDVSRQIALFNSKWMSFCPILASEEIVRHAQRLFDLSAGTRLLESFDYAILQTILLVTSVNKVTKIVWEDEEPLMMDMDDPNLQLARRIFSETLSRADSWCLQALLILALRVQISGARLEMVRLNGLLVRIAQSLGLHRHTRRFTFETCEVEWRKRMWWSVYIFDK